MTAYSGLEHIHKRKRKYHKNLKKYPNKNPKIKLLDDIMLFVAGMAPLFLLPQIIKVYRNRDGSGLSAITFLLLALTHISWIVYAIVHKDRQILLSHSLFLIATISLTIAAIIF